MRGKIVYLIFLLLTLISFASCNNSDDEIPKVSTVLDPDSNDLGGSTGSTIAGFGTLSGALNTNALIASGADIIVEGHPEYNTTADSSGEFVISNMLPGTYTIYAISDDASKAAQFYEIVVPADSETALPATLLTDPGSISGSVEILNNPNNVTIDGISVYIPGTSFSATTDGGGNFSMTGVPAGSYDSVAFSKSGLSNSSVGNITVSSGANNALGLVYMALSTGPSGEITDLLDGSNNPIATMTTSHGTVAVISNNTVKIDMKYDTRAVLMKVAHESSFLNVDWEPISTSYDFSLAANTSANTYYSTDGLKNVYLKFADLNGLESSVYQLQFVIDTQNPTMTSVKILHGWSTTASIDVLVDIVASDLGTGIKEVMISNVSSAFTNGESWQAYSSQINSWDLVDPGTLGPKNIYLKIRDYLDNESIYLAETSNDEIVLSSVTTVYPGTYEDIVTFEFRHQPFHLDGHIIFSNEVIIEPGSTLVFNNGTTGEFDFFGKVTANATNGNEITIEANVCNSVPDLELDDAPSGTTHIFNEVIFKNVSLNVNGASITNSNFDGACGGTNTGSVNKDGYDSLLIDSCSYTDWGKVLVPYGGIGSITISNSSGSVASVISHNGATLSYGTDTVFTNNNFDIKDFIINFMWIGEGDIISSASSNNTFNLTEVKTGLIYIQNSSVARTINLYNFTVTESVAGNCSNFIDLDSFTTLNLSGVTVTCTDLIYDAAGTVNFSDSTINVREALVNSSIGIETDVNVDNSTITCANSSGVPCDFLFEDHGMNTTETTDSISITNSTINCFEAGNCRGFVYTASGLHTANFNINLDGNTWIGKARPADFKTNIINATTGGVNDPTTDDPSFVRLFEYMENGVVGTWNVTP